MPRIATFDPDAIDEIDALYLMDLLNEKFQYDMIAAGLSDAAFELAGDYDRADEIYPQTVGIWNEHTRREHIAKRDEHLKRFGLLKEIGE